MTSVQATEQLALCEKLLINGVHNLSDIELLAMFINPGISEMPCVQLATNLLTYLGDLRAVLNAAPNRFRQIPELGSNYYAQLQAIQEICRRSDFIQLQKETQITNSKQTIAYLKKRMRDYKNETFAALFLDNQHRIIAYEELFFGTVNTATIYSRPIVERVLQLNAAALILAHNHPSGVSDASHQDIAVTERIRDALELIDARLLDHIVIGDNEVYSIIAESKWICN
jgi:DNA repair protein RadC